MIFPGSGMKFLESENWIAQIPPEYPINFIAMCFPDKGFYLRIKSFKLSIRNYYSVDKFFSVFNKEN